MALSISFHTTDDLTPGLPERSDRRHPGLSDGLPLEPSASLRRIDSTTRGDDDCRARPVEETRTPSLVGCRIKCCCAATSVSCRMFTLPGDRRLTEGLALLTDHAAVARLPAPRLLVPAGWRRSRREHFRNGDLAFDRGLPRSALPLRSSASVRHWLTNWPGTERQGVNITPA